MPQVSPLTKSSMEKLNTCHSDLVRLVMDVSLHLSLTVIEGHRSKERQELLVKEGRSKRLDGKHTRSPSDAIDIAPLPIDWKNLPKWAEFGKFVLERADALGIKIRWGGDWDMDGEWKDEKFFDAVHFERIS